VDLGDLAAQFRNLVGRRHVLTGAEATCRFCTGHRYGGGAALVVRPGSLVEMWRVLQACVAAEANIIVQAANTGLTGGSTPWGEYDRPVVIINTLRIRGVRPIRNGEQVVCLAGATLYELERLLRPLGREPHSVIGSSCIGASVIGGLCNNSGGSLVRRGPAFTELSLFARLRADGRLELVNHLGIGLGSNPEEILRALDEDADLDPRLVESRGQASDHSYMHEIRDVGAVTPARFNADPRRLFEAAGSAGKVAVFAARFDTFPQDERTATFYIGVNTPFQLERLRRCLLMDIDPLPIAGEYMHRTAFDLADRYGRDLFLIMGWLGTDRLPALYRVKSLVDGLARRAKWLPRSLSDHLLQALSRFLPPHLPRRMRLFRDLYEHHLILKVSEEAIETTRAMLDQIISRDEGDWFECSADESEKAFRHRFVTASAAIRFRAVHPRQAEEVVAIDVALRRNEIDWAETLPAHLDALVLHKLYYGHFLCHVMHQDYVLRKGQDPEAFEHAICELLDKRGAEYPAEHNVGHLYAAKPALAAHYRALDPRNRFNPGIGRLTKKVDWGCEQACPSEDGRKVAS
jgi:D-lactate dehydrogenase (quinone)